jgi:hypothetical protein
MRVRNVKRALIFGIDSFDTGRGTGGLFVVGGWTGQIFGVGTTTGGGTGKIVGFRTTEERQIFGVARIVDGRQRGRVLAQGWHSEGQAEDSEECAAVNHGMGGSRRLR